MDLVLPPPVNRWGANIPSTTAVCKFLDLDSTKSILVNINDDRIDDRTSDNDVRRNDDDTIRWNNDNFSSDNRRINDDDDNNNDDDRASDYEWGEEEVEEVFFLEDNSRDHYFLTIKSKPRESLSQIKKLISKET